MKRSRCGSTRTHSGRGRAPLQFCRFLLVLFLAGGASPVSAQLPTARLDALLPGGGARGTTVRVRLVGGDLDEVETLRFGHPGITAAPTVAMPGPFDVPGPRTNAEFIVSIEETVPVGVYEAIAVGRFGTTNPRVFVVGTLNEIAEVDAAEVALETTINGVIEKPTEVDAFRFSAFRDDRVLVTCLAQRMDSALDGVLYLYDASGNEISRNRSYHRHDPFLDVTIPKDGEYTVKLRDFTFRGGNLFFYRLSIGTFPQVDFVFPPCVAPGQTTSLTLYGRNLPGSERSAWELPGGGVLEKLEVSFVAPWQPLSRAFGADQMTFDAAQAGLDVVPYRLETAWGTTHPVPLGLASAPVVLEAGPNDTPAKAQRVTIPIEVAGQFYPTGDRDWFEFQAEKGERLRIEVISQRMGSGSDPFLTVGQVVMEEGKEVTREVASADDVGAPFGPNFNTASEDAALDFTAGETGTYRVSVENLFGNSMASPRDLYRLVIRDLRPDFRLVAMPRYAGGGVRLWGSFLRRGGTYLLDVFADRRGGLESEIQLRVEGLPAGVHSAGAVIGRGQSVGVLVLEAADNAEPWTGSLQVIGEALVGGNTISREARPGTVAFPGGPQGAVARSRLAGEIHLTVADAEQQAFRVSVDSSRIVDLVRGGETKIPLRLSRRGGFDRAVNCEPQALPGGVTFVEGEEKKAAKNLPFAKDQDAHEGVLSAKKDAAIGLYSVYFKTSASVSYRRNAEASERAGSWKKKLDATIVALETAVATTKELVATAETLERLAGEAGERLAGEAGGVVPVTYAAAQETKAVAAKAGEESAAKLTEAKAAVEGVAKLADETAKAAAPKDVNVVFVAGPLFVRIVDVPFELTLEHRAAVVTQGSRLEVPCSLLRRFGFDGDVVVRAELPATLKGVTFSDLTFAKGTDGNMETTGTLVFDVAGDATTGRYVATLHASGTFAETERKLSVLVPLRVVAGSLVSQ